MRLKKKIGLLDTIPGISRRTDEALLAEDRAGDEPLSLGQTSGVMGGDVSWRSRECRHSKEWQDAQR